MTKELICLRCGHKWTPRQENVKICPKCKSTSWDTQRDGTPRPSGIRIEGRKVWTRVSDLYSPQEKEFARAEMDGFIKWIGSKDGDKKNG